MSETLTVPGEMSDDACRCFGRDAGVLYSLFVVIVLFGVKTGSETRSHE